MFKGQPKGLFITALANLGKRFGFYTMIAIFVLYHEKAGKGSCLK